MTPSLLILFASVGLTAALAVVAAITLQHLKALTAQFAETAAKADALARHALQVHLVNVEMGKAFAQLGWAVEVKWSDATHPQVCLSATVAPALAPESRGVH